jgi:hypothetical protein
MPVLAIFELGAVAVLVAYVQQKCVVHAEPLQSNKFIVH